MEFEAKEERPPYLRFEKRPVEDRDASIKAGCYMTKDVDFVYITPTGTRDVIERQVSEWFAYLAELVKQGRFRSDWLAAFKEAHKLWGQGQEIPLKGMPIKTWPVLSPAQRDNCIKLMVLTVEDLAQANEETLGRMGMGAMALKQRAIDWLKNAKDPSKVSEELNAIRIEMAAIRTRADALEERNAALERELAVYKPTPPKPEVRVEKRLVEGELVEVEVAA